MDPVLTIIAVFAIFIPALMLPGPDFVAVVRSTVAHGFSGGAKTTLGVSLVLTIYAGLSVVGLAAVLAEFEGAAWLIRILGGAYLCYLGVRLLLSSRSALDETALSADDSPNRAFLFGVAVTLTNPKALVLFGSVFATAITPETPFWVSLTLVAGVGLSSLVWYLCVSAFLSAPPVLERLKRAAVWVERAAGICFIAIGGKLIADARNPVTP